MGEFAEDMLSHLLDRKKRCTTIQPLEVCDLSEGMPQVEVYFHNYPCIPTDNQP